MVTDCRHPPTKPSISAAAERSDSRVTCFMYFFNLFWLAAGSTAFTRQDLGPYLHLLGSRSYRPASQFPRVQKSEEVI